MLANPRQVVELVERSSAWYGRNRRLSKDHEYHRMQRGNGLSGLDPLGYILGRVGLHTPWCGKEVTMPRDPELYEGIRAWLETKGAWSVACPACGQHTWVLGDIIAAPVYEARPSVDVSVFTMVPVVCENCFYVRLFAIDPTSMTK